MRIFASEGGRYRGFFLKQLNRQDNLILPQASVLRVSKALNRKTAGDDDWYDNRLWRQPISRAGGMTIKRALVSLAVASAIARGLHWPRDGASQHPLGNRRELRCRPPRDAVR
jgi:hypothetical protein